MPAILPTDVFENFSVETVETVKGIFIPLASLPGLTEAEANPTTGDGREVVRILVTTAANNLDTLATPPTALSWRNVTAQQNGRSVQDVNFIFNVVVPPSGYILEAEAS